MSNSFCKFDVDFHLHYLSIRVNSKMFKIFLRSVILALKVSIDSLSFARVGVTLSPQELSGSPPPGVETGAVTVASQVAISSSADWEWCYVAKITVGEGSSTQHITQSHLHCIDLTLNSVYIDFNHIPDLEDRGRIDLRRLRRL